jgi:hypothetical protein
MNRRIIGIIAAGALAIAPACWAQSPLAGEWQGTLNAGGGTQFRIAWHVTAAKDGSFSATIDNLDLGILAIPVKSMTVKDSAITQVIDSDVQINGEAHSVKGTFAGNLSKDGSEIKGTWTQTEPAQPPAELVMKHAGETAVKPAEPPAIVGDWLGILSMQGSDMHVVLHVIAAKDGTLSATSDVPDQGIMGTPGSAVTFKDSKLSINFDTYNGVYAGTLSADGTTIKGTWTAGEPVDLNFTRAAAPAAPVVPKPPDPKN